MVPGRGVKVDEERRSSTTVRGRHKIKSTLGQDSTTTRGRHRFTGAYTMTPLHKKTQCKTVDRQDCYSDTTTRACDREVSAKTGETGGGGTEGQ